MLRQRHREQIQSADADLTSTPTSVTVEQAEQVIRDRRHWDPLPFPALYYNNLKS